jgi:hypothetical protein
MKKTIRIGDVDVEAEIVQTPDGDEVRSFIRDRKTGGAAVGLQMTKAQASTLGDIFKVLAR